jgi:ferric-dicitrate binding protein FerR (iron transport regulator)
MTDERQPMPRVGAVIDLLAKKRARAASASEEPTWDHLEPSIPPATSNISPKAGSGRLLGIAAVVAVAAGTFLMLGFRADSRLSYELRGGAAHGGVIEAQRGEATVSLSDGSSILAENQTKFSVDVVGRNAALTRLVSGRLHVKVEHNDDTSYRFLAGPYEVRVVGTEFDLAWDPDGAGLSLAMSKGEVKLSEVGGKLRTLKAGQSLSLPRAAARAGSTPD